VCQEGSVKGVLSDHDQHGGVEGAVAVKGLTGVEVSTSR
jgi:hypothetical protein